MAHIRKMYIKMKVPNGAVISERDGKKFARWKRRNGQIVNASIEADGKVLVESDKYYIEYTDHLGKRQKVVGFTDLKLTERRAVKLEHDVERIVAGELTPSAARRQDMTLLELAERWHKSVIADGNTPKHADLCRTRIAKVINAGELQTLAELQPDRVMRIISELKTSHGHPISRQSINHYVTTCKAFARWLQYADYAESNRLLRLEKIGKVVPVTERRALTKEQFELLVETAARSARVNVLPGRDRAVLYLIAAYTGLRKAEISSLTRDSFRLDDEIPVVIVHARSTKNSKQAVLPIPKSILERLREYLADKSDGILFPMGTNTSRMVQLDLREAGIPVKDDQGRKFDFHSLRGQYATNLALAGVPLQHAQKLLRHSSPLLATKFYTRLDLENLANQVEKL